MAANRSSEPAGYRISPEVFVLQMKETGKGGAGLVGTIPAKETAAKESVIRGGVRVAKFDQETEGLVSAPAVFSVINNSKEAVVVGGKTYQK